MTLPTFVSNLSSTHFKSALSLASAREAIKATFLALALVLTAPLVLTQAAQAQDLAQAELQAAEPTAVNINQADAASLASALQGVGLTRAEDIIRYRETYGPFKTIEELADVKGIGPATLDKNRARITLE
ncbi:helix-hairpin-helix domain-containing protein [Parahaliea sp. F7430]|uniref:Helix-hairpin-helix domain-containing protein n=1 Tax=Sediminihaliea albiluteola TaxID=2758564 RepID=A0A7W2TVU0_9GAMM|nr:helix-hairpin-helix domain-containing protein [Sediminihaliea albiluteola]MBA6412855.1 helix-hairpin-helix domain-containing protein [Sediminihaliea albiluteola]